MSSKKNIAKAFFNVLEYIIKNSFVSVFFLLLGISLGYFLGLSSGESLQNLNINIASNTTNNQRYCIVGEAPPINLKK